MHVPPTRGIKSSLNAGQQLSTQQWKAGFGRNTPVFEAVLKDMVSSWGHGFAALKGWVWRISGVLVCWSAQGSASIVWMTPVLHPVLYSNLDLWTFSLVLYFFSLCHSFLGYAEVSWIHKIMPPLDTCDCAVTDLAEKFSSRKRWIAKNGCYCSFRS